MTTESDSPQETNSLVTPKQYALMYATEFGLPVFPLNYPMIGGGCSCGIPDCKDVAKHPLYALAPHGLKNATTDPFVIASWFDKEPDANIGIVTGSASGFFVVDVDAKSGGLETWAELQDFHGPANTISIQTGGGGNHYWFKTDGQEIKNSVSKVGPGIDIRGEGGYIIAPPSEHISGDAYEFEEFPMPGTMASAPDWLVAMFRDAEKPSSDGIPTPSTVEVTEGQRNDHLARLGGAARQKGASEAGVSALLLAENGNLDSPLPEGEVAKVAKSISRYEPSAGPLPEPLAVKYLNSDDFDVVTTHQLAGAELVIGAREIRKERTGIHAVVEVHHGGRLLSFNNFNVGRSRDRHDLSRACHAKLTEDLKKVVAKETLEMYIDGFCYDVYPKSLKNLSPSPLYGDPNIPITMICGDYITEGGGTILFAQPGHGKSFTAIAMAISIDAGKHTIWNVKQSRVLYVNLERSQASMQRRLGQCNAALGVDPKRSLRMLNTRGRPLEAVKDNLRRYIQEEGIQVLFLDSISRSGQGSLSSDEDTNRTIDLLNNLCPTWLAIGHTPRADSSHIFGSIHFEAGADLMVSLTSQTRGKRMGIGLTVQKANDTPKPPMGQFALVFGDNGLVGIDKVHDGEFYELENAVKPSLLSLVIGYLQEHEGGGTATEMANELDGHRPDISTLLKNNQAFKSLGKQGVRGVVYVLKDE